MGSHPQRFIGVFSQCTAPLFAWHVPDKLRRFSTIGVTHVSFQRYHSEHDITLIYFFSITFSLLLVSVFNASGCICRCVCHLSFSRFLCLPLPLPDSWLVWRHQTVCIFSAATDGAMAACQRPECSLSQLSGHFFGPKWIPSTFRGVWRSFFFPPAPFLPLIKLRF